MRRAPRCDRAHIVNDFVLAAQDALATYSTRYEPCASLRLPKLYAPVALIRAVAIFVLWPAETLYSLTVPPLRRTLPYTVRWVPDLRTLTVTVGRTLTLCTELYEEVVKR